MDFMLNETKITTPPMSISSQIKHDKPNQNVTNGEIKLTRLSGDISLIDIEIISKNEPADPGATRKEVGKNTFIGGDCMSNNTKNCIFDEAQLSKIKCDGNMIKIPANATNKNLACM